MPAGIKHPLWWKPNGRHKHTVNNTFEKISNSKPSVRSRRLTSFHSRTYRESEWKSRKSKRARKFPEVYVSPPWDRIPASDTRLLPLLAGGQATVFHRILPFKFENWKALGFHSPYNTKLVVTSQRIGLRIIPEKNWYAVKLYLWKDGARQLTNSPVPRLFFFLFFFRIVPFIQNRFHLCN